MYSTAFFGGAVAGTIDKMRSSMCKVAAAYLRPAETIQCVFPAQSSPGYATLIANITAPAPFPFSAINSVASLFGLRNRSRIFVVTDQRILVLDAGRAPTSGPLDSAAVSRAVGVVAELPRSTRLGPPSSLVYMIKVKEGENLRVFEEWFKDVEKADSEAPSEPGAEGREPGVSAT
jgi:hypothetical protein